MASRKMEGIVPIGSRRINAGEFVSTVKLRWGPMHGQNAVQNFVVKQGEHAAPPLEVLSFYPDERLRYALFDTGPERPLFYAKTDNDVFTYKSQYELLTDRCYWIGVALARHDPPGSHFQKTKLLKHWWMSRYGIRRVVDDLDNRTHESWTIRPDDEDLNLLRPVREVLRRFFSASNQMVWDVDEGRRALERNSRMMRYASYLPLIQEHVAVLMLFRKEVQPFLTESSDLMLREVEHGREDLLPILADELEGRGLADPVVLAAMRHVSPSCSFCSNPVTAKTIAIGDCVMMGDEGRVKLANPCKACGYRLDEREEVVGQVRNITYPERPGTEPTFVDVILFRLFYPSGYYGNEHYPLGINPGSTVILELQE